MWVAIDCRYKNWVAMLKSLGSTVLDNRLISKPQVTLKFKDLHELFHKSGGTRIC
jgi:hypothetical protein